MILYDLILSALKDVERRIETLEESASPAEAATLRLARNDANSLQRMIEYAQKQRERNRG